MKLNLGTTMPFPEKFLHNKRDTMDTVIEMSTSKISRSFVKFKKMLK